MVEVVLRIKGSGGIDLKQSDVVIVGGGPAGYAAAIRASQLGGRVLRLRGAIIKI